MQHLANGLSIDQNVQFCFAYNLFLDWGGARNFPTGGLTPPTRGVESRE